MKWICDKCNKGDPCVYVPAKKMRSVISPNDCPIAGLAEWRINHDDKTPDD